MSADDTPVPSNEELEETYNMLQAALSALPGLTREEERVPESVLAGARWVHDWANMDAELAQLTNDRSAGLVPANVRSSSQIRHLSFTCGSVQVEIDIEPVESGSLISGNISPPTLGTVRAAIGGIAYEGVIDDQGTFVIDNVSPGLVMAYIEIEGGSVRLDSFEL